MIPYQTFQTPPNILKEGEGGGMKVKRGGKGSLVGLGEKRMEIAEGTLKIQKSDCLQENLDPFIASIYM